VLVDRHQVIGLAAGIGKAVFQELVKGFQPLDSPVLPGPHFAEITPQLDKAGIALGFAALLPG